MGGLTLTGDKLVVAIRTEHEAASAAARSALEHALECGRLLAQARAQVPHGSWENYLTDTCGIAPRTGRLYLRLHAHRDRLGNRQRVAGLTLREAAKMVAEPRPEVAKAECKPAATMLDEEQVLHRLDEVMNVAQSCIRGAHLGESIDWQMERIEAVVRLAQELHAGVRPAGPRAWLIGHAIDMAKEARGLATGELEPAQVAERSAPIWYSDGQMHEGVHSAGWLVEVWPHPGGPEWVHFAVAVPGVHGASHLEGPKRGCRVDRLSQVMSQVYHLPDVDGPGWDWNERPIGEDEAELVAAHYNARLYTCASEYADLELR